MDHFSSEKQDFYFVRAVWHTLLESETLSRFTDIKIWSDGGPQHFKVAKTLFFFSTLQSKYGKTFTYNFFASGHGHSLCDSHTGVGKQKLKREERENNSQMIGAQDIADSYNELKKTSTQVLSTIDKTPLKLVSSFSDGIRCFHQFEFSSKIGEIKCRSESDFGNFVIQNVSEDVNMEIE